MAERALAEGDRLLPIEILRHLAARSEGEERSFYRAVLLIAEGRKVDGAAALEALFERTGGLFEPAWATPKLFEWLTASRLERRREEEEQRLEEVLAAHYEARGGFDRILSMSDLVAYGDASTETGAVPVRLARKRPNFYRLDLGLPGSTQIEASDGQTPWRLVVDRHGIEGHFVGDPDRKRLLRNGWFDDVLVRFRSTGEELLLVEPRTLEGETAVYRIDIAGPAGQRETALLDQETLLEVRRIIWGEPGAPPEMIIELEHADFDGLMLPSRQVVQTDTGRLEIAFDRYELGTELDRGAFDLENVRKWLLEGQGGDNQRGLPPCN